MMKYATLAKLRRDAGPGGRDAGRDWLALSVAGGYLYLCERGEIPADALDRYAPLRDARAALRLIEASLSQGYRYL